MFHAATTYTCLLFLDRAGRDEFRFERVADLAAWREANVSTVGAVSTAGTVSIAGAGLLTVPLPATAALIPADRATAAEWNFTVGTGAALFEKLRAMPVKLGSVTSRIFQGIKTSADKIYIVEEVNREENQVRVYSREKEREFLT